jgi:Fe-Mn family superoxide dismutase
MNRRDILVGGAAITALIGSKAQAGEPASFNSSTPTPAPASTGPFSLPALPYKEDALSPVISANTMSYHYGKHHKGYVDKLNSLVENTDYAKLSLDALIKKAKEDGKTAIFNNAAQIAHHSFYWSSMKPGGGGIPPAGALLTAINTSFKSFDDFKKQFIDDASGLFGSGWCWLVLDSGALKIVKTSNAELPTGKALLVIDVWEHAYYLDYQNKRKDYVTVWLDKLANWEQAATLLGG